jgi:tubby-related protein 1
MFLNNVNGLHLLSGRKRSLNNTSNYLICSTKDDMSKKSKGYLGKLRSNFLGTEFMLYDTGVNPKKCKEDINKVRK